MDRIDKPCGSRGSGPLVYRKDIPAGDHIAGSKLLEADSGQRPYVQGINVHQIAWKPREVLFRLADCVRPLATPAPYRDRPALGFDKPPPAFEEGNDTANGCSRGLDALGSKQDLKACISPSEGISPEASLPPR